MNRHTKPRQLSLSRKAVFGLMLLAVVVVAAAALGKNRELAPKELPAKAQETPNKPRLRSNAS